MTPFHAQEWSFDPHLQRHDSTRGQSQTSSPPRWSPSAQEMHAGRGNRSQSTDNVLQLDLEGLDLGGPVVSCSSTPPSEGHGSPGKRSPWTRTSARSGPAPPQGLGGSVPNNNGTSSSKRKGFGKQSPRLLPHPPSLPDVLRAPPSPCQTNSEIDSFVAHLRDDCAGTNEILGSDAILRANAIGVTASTNQGSASRSHPEQVMFSPSDFLTAPPMRSSRQGIAIPRSRFQASSAYARPRGSPPRKMQWQAAVSEQVLGGFASLGLPSLSQSSQSTGATMTGNNRTTSTATHARLTDRRDDPSSTAENALSGTITPASDLELSDSDNSHYRWQAILPRKRTSDAAKILDMMSIDEISKYAVDVGHMQHWEGIALVPDDAVDDNEAELGSAWRAARKTHRQRQWICSPLVSDEDQAANRTIIVSDVTAQPSRKTPPSATRESAGSKKPLAVAPSSFDLRFLRGHLSDRTVLLATPVHLQALYRKAGATARACSVEGQSDSARKPRTRSFGATERVRRVRKALMLDGPADLHRPRFATSQPLRRTQSALQLHPFPFAASKDPLAPPSRRRSFDASHPDGITLQSSALGKPLLRSPQFTESAAGLLSTLTSHLDSNHFPPMPAEAKARQYAVNGSFWNLDDSVFQAEPKYRNDMADTLSPKSIVLSQNPPKLAAQNDQVGQAEATLVDTKGNAPMFSAASGSTLISALDTLSKAKNGMSKTASVRLNTNIELPMETNGLPKVPRLRREPSKLGDWFRKKIGGGSFTSRAVESAPPSPTGHSSPTAPLAAAQLHDIVDSSATQSPFAKTGDPFAFHREAVTVPFDNSLSVAPSTGWRSDLTSVQTTEGADSLSQSTSLHSHASSLHNSMFASPHISSGRKGGNADLQYEEPQRALRASLTTPYASGRRASASDDDIVAHAGQAARNLSFGTINKRTKLRRGTTSKAAGAPPIHRSPHLLPSPWAAASAPRISSPLAQRKGVLPESSTAVREASSRLAHERALSEERSPDTSDFTFGLRKLQLLGIENVPMDALSMIFPLPLSSSSRQQQRYLRVNFVPFGGEQSTEGRVTEEGLSKLVQGQGVCDTGNSDAQDHRALASISPPTWYQRLGGGSDRRHAKTKSTSSDENFQPEAREGFMPTYLFGAGPAAAAADPREGDATTGNRQRSRVEAFRVTAMVLSVPESDVDDDDGDDDDDCEEERGASNTSMVPSSHAHSTVTATSMRISRSISPGATTSTTIGPAASLATVSSPRAQHQHQHQQQSEKENTSSFSSSCVPDPTPFPIVLVTCYGHSLEFVPEGWEALGLGSGPVEKSGSAKEDGTDNSALFGVADLIVAGCAAVMDL